jgi:hypothetical protein
MRTLTGAVLGLLLLGGCASSGGTWTKTGGTPEEQRKDTSDCLLRAREMVGGPQGPRPVVDQTKYRDCMTSRGYTIGSETK